MQKFKLISNFKPTGDQPQAIAKLINGLKKGYKAQTLLGVTGSGKTFTMANIIEKVQRPALIISHNKTLAAQLYGEFRQFFPDAAVHYFVSYYDYYQPEAYIPHTDTYIEKEATINEEIDRLRHAATQSLINRKDVIVVASVSCIYGIGEKKDYEALSQTFTAGQKIKRNELLRQLVKIQYERNDIEFKRGQFRVRGENIDIHLATGEEIIRIIMLGDIINNIYLAPTSRLIPHPPAPSPKQEMVTNNPPSYLGGAGGGINRGAGGGIKIPPLLAKERGLGVRSITILPAKHFMTPEDRMKSALKLIRKELEERLRELKKLGKEMEAYRLEKKTNYDLEMMAEVGYCNGIENYSLHLTGRSPGSPPATLMDFFPKDFLIFVDESHVTLPQIRGMHAGDRSRKQTLIDFGFRLPSARDNRPLNFREFNSKINQIIYTSATPTEYEIKKSSQTVEQIIRPTGLLDPEIEIRPETNQISDLIKEIKKRAGKGQRILATTLTKRMAEDLADYLKEEKIKAAYLHSEIGALERVDILRDLRKGKYDCLVGINLLREGLDLPEVSLVAILDADMSGFLRNETALIQTMGRAARHSQGKVIMYAGRITPAMRYAINETNRRRKIQIAYNKKHNITPASIKTKFHESMIS
ncbi:excinuclease ABC subunit UvrB [Candidatus Parcubacteria bacterium]|nr:excinuclease ABC subunit UvrB [Candidatus Parcubacteria bacterium]